jgi:hypothetical protein
MPGHVKSVVLAAVAAAAITSAATPAHAAAVKEIFERHDLLGTLASDCTKPPDAKTPYLSDRLIDADHVELDKMIGPTKRESATIVDKASETKPNELTLSATIDDQRYEIVVQVERGRIRTMEMTGADGKKMIAGGHVSAGGAETPWYGRCLQKVTIHNAPEGGGKCIQPLNGDIKAAVRLETWDCNDMPQQIFAFDTLNGRVSVGDFCVDAVGERSSQGIDLALAPCNGGPTQSLKAETSGNYVKLIGAEGLCVDINSEYKGINAAVHLWQCSGAANQAWQLVPALDLTWEENGGRNGHFIANFNLAGADPRLCQASCIANRACRAWTYRKPEGRGDHQPHCWLWDKIEGSSHDTMVVSGSVRPQAK